MTEEAQDDSGPKATTYQWSVSEHQGVQIGSPGAIAFINVFIPFSRLKDLKYSVLAGVVADALTSNLPASVGAAVIAQVASVVRKLSRDELEVLWVINKCSYGHPYTVWVELDDIVEEAISEDIDRDKLLRTLANMKSRGILEDGAGKWRAVW